MALHSGLTDPQIHEPKGISTASAKEVYVADGAGSGSWEPKLPDMTSASGKYLTNNGTTESWNTIAVPTVACRVTVSGTTPTLVAGSTNVASVTRTSTGLYRVNFTSALSDTNYIPMSMPGPYAFALTTMYTTLATGYIDINFYIYNGSVSDPAGFSLVIFGG